MELAVVVVTEMHHIASAIVEPILSEGVVCAAAAPILETIRVISMIRWAEIETIHTGTKPWTMYHDPQAKVPPRGKRAPGG